ncbi:hypothetical protein ACQP2T_61100 [Nonomuraea sp. CA-143628]|uniref:hypothetical protein n=1 Tax=Nonomuraea sp. CA-143628 TaxID=3239997 RepID=UPI003D9154FF
MSEVARADHITSFFASGGTPDNRAGENNYQGVLWAHVVGRPEPVRIDGFVGTTPAKILNEMTQMIAEVASNRVEPVIYIRLHSTEGRMPVSKVEVYQSFPGV